MRPVKSTLRPAFWVALFALVVSVLSPSAARADWHGGGGWRGGPGWHGGGWHGGPGWGGGWGWHNGVWGCCWRGGVFIGVAPPVFVPPPVFYPPPPVFYAPPPGYFGLPPW